MSADDAWKAILDSQAKTDAKKTAENEKAVKDKEAQEKATAEAKIAWQARQKNIEDRIRTMNSQMSGGRQLFPKTEKNGPMQIAVFSVYSKYHVNNPGAPRCQFQIYYGGGGQVVFNNQRVASDIRQKPRATFDARTVSDDELAAHLFEFVKEFLT
jgi:hypothetical protein